MYIPKIAMIVDDEAHMRLYLKLILKEIGVETVLEAANGYEGLERYKQDRPELVLMDINMPIMDGLDALEKITEFDEDAVVIMMTSVASRQSVEKSAYNGAVQYMRKDTPKADLSRLIIETLEELELA